MSLSNRRRWRILRDYAIGWTLAFVFLSIVRGEGTEELGSLKFDLASSLILSVTMGPIMGLVSGCSEILIEERIYRRISIQKLLLLRLLYTFVFLIFLTFLAYFTYQFYFGTEVNLVTFAFDKGSFAIYFYVISVDFLMGLLRQVNLMLGTGNLGKLLRARFYTPKEEERIFMFLDLQSSTQLAERFGHIKYSMFIQDCFNDLGVVIEHDAEIYQYVGDEAVLSWKLKNGIRKQNCIKAFFRFKQQIESREEYYQSTYGSIPFFKAGLHGGMVTATEVGKYKKEIAYHGDPINTAARIQGLCNTFEQELLISEDLMKMMAQNGFTFTKMGDMPLRGKEKEVSVYAVKES
ncbi:MAG: adenylate/guanylate cyclase domain-containing protein [Bacteroidota bacterium]